MSRLYLGALALTLEGAARATGVIIVSLAVLYFISALLFFGLTGDETIVADGAFLMKSDVLRSKMGAGCAD